MRNLPLELHWISTRNDQIGLENFVEWFSKHITFDLEWSTWGSWTECSKTCGRGNKSRRRVCSGVNRKACTGNSDERKDCNAISCEPSKWCS